MILAKRPDVERFLSQPPTSIRGALIHGRDRAGVHERADRLAGAATARPDDPFDVALLTESDIDGDPVRLADELSARSLSGGRRLVRLKLTGERQAIERAAAEALKAHDEGAFNPEAFFLIETTALGRDSPLRKTAEKAEHFGAIACYDDEAGDVARLVREALARDRLSLSPDALELIVSRLPHERGVVRQEIERLVLFLGPGSNQTARPEDLEAFLGVEPEASLADAAEHAFGGKLAAAHAGLRRAAAEGEAGAAAVRALGGHLSRLRRTLTLARNGADLGSAAKASGVFWRNEREFLRQARAWNLEQLDALQPEILDADLACKQTGSPDPLIAERLALTIAGRARRLGL
jgi:DNA polymerase III subunit delta